MGDVGRGDTVTLGLSCLRVRGCGTHECRKSKGHGQTGEHGSTSSRAGWQLQYTSLSTRGIRVRPRPLSMTYQALPMIRTAGLDTAWLTFYTSNVIKLTTCFE